MLTCVVLWLLLHCVELVLWVYCCVVLTCIVVCFCVLLCRVVLWWVVLCCALFSTHTHRHRHTHTHTHTHANACTNANTHTHTHTHIVPDFIVLIHMCVCVYYNQPTSQQLGCLFECVRGEFSFVINDAASGHWG